jgi:hypothetical protein
VTACPVCGNDPCIYNLSIDWDRGNVYVVNGWRVSKEDYVWAERRAGFYNRLGHPNEPTTSSFENARRSLSGHIEHDPLPSSEDDEASLKTGLNDPDRPTSY